MQRRVDESQNQHHRYNAACGRPNGLVILSERYRNTLAGNLTCQCVSTWACPFLAHFFGLGVAVALGVPVGVRVGPAGRVGVRVAVAVGVAVDTGVAVAAITGAG